MRYRSCPASLLKEAVRASREGRVVVLKGASAGKSEQVIRIVRPPGAHVPMQHQAGWQPPIITR